VKAPESGQAVRKKKNRKEKKKANNCLKISHAVGTQPILICFSKFTYPASRETKKPLLAG